MEKTLLTLKGHNVHYVKDYFLNSGFPEYWEEPYKSYTDWDWIDLADEYDLD